MSIISKKKDHLRDGSSEWVFTHLPMEAIEHSVLFLDNVDQVKMTLMSKRTLEAVERLCEKALKRIIQKQHAVDRTFQARIRDQERIETTRVKPVHLPWRYLLWAALRTHLYKISSGDHGDMIAGVGKPALSPSEDKLGSVSGHGGRSMRLFNLSTKEHLFTLGQDTYNRALWLDDNQLLTHSLGGEICIWHETEDGSWNVTDVVGAGRGWPTGLVIHNNEILFGQKGAAFRSSLFHLRSLDLGDRSVTTKFTVDIRQQGFGNFIDGHIFVHDDKWLVVSFYLLFPINEEQGDRSLIYVYNVDTNEMIRVLNIPWRHVIQASNCSHTFFKFGENQLEVCNLGEDGSLSETSSFAARGVELMAATRSHVVLAKAFDGNESEVFIYSVQKGELERVLHLEEGAAGAVISETRKELLIANENEVAVVAYSLEDPPSDAE